MKICSCGKENYFREDTCERCNQSIQHINHEPFDCLEFILNNKRVYAVVAGFLGFKFFNVPIPFFQAISLVILSVAVLLLLASIWRAYHFCRPFRQIENPPHGDLFIFIFFQIAVILGIVGYEIWPTQNGITTLPAFLFYFSLIAFIKVYTSTIRFNKKWVLAWIFVYFIATLEIFLTIFLSIWIFANFHLDPNLYYWSSIISFSIFFLFFGLMAGYSLTFVIVNLLNQPIGRQDDLDYVNYLDFLYREETSLDDIYLQFAFGIAILGALVLTPIFLQILAHPQIL